MGVPGDHRHAGEHGAQRAGGVSVHDDLAAGRVHACHPVRMAPLETLGLREASPGRGHVELAGLGLLAEDAADGGLDLGHLDVEQAGHHPHVGHVAEQLAKPGLPGDGLDHLVEGHRVEDQVGTRALERQRGVVDHGRTGGEPGHVLPGRLRVHGHEEVDLLLAGHVAVPRCTDRVPGGQARRCSTGKDSYPRPGSPSGTATGAARCWSSATRNRWRSRSGASRRWSS